MTCLRLHLVLLAVSCPVCVAFGQCKGTTIADDVVAGANLTGHVAIVTGGDSELGYPVVRALARQGARVVVASHNLAKCQAAARKAKTETGGDVAAMVLDLSTFLSVRSFARQFLADFGPRLHILVNNAGIAGNPPHESSDGFQLLFQVNYLSPFLLTELLLPALRAGGEASYPARVVNVGSSEHQLACEAAGWPEGCLRDWTYLPPPSVPDRNVTIHYPDGGVEVRPIELYGFTKLLHIQHAAELAHREASMGTFVEAFSLTPGWVNTSLTRMIKMDSPVARRKCAVQKPNPCPFTPDEGAAITAFCAVQASQSGAYLSRIAGCQEDRIVSHGFRPAMRPELYGRSLRWAGLDLAGGGGSATFV